MYSKYYTGKIMADKKTTMKIKDTTYNQLQQIRLDCTKCKYNDDTIKMLIRFYRMNNARKPGGK